MDASLGFFSGFNARHLDAEQVARSFVPGPKFYQLLGQQHSLLIGARGSGKTHMLKMLQPKALNAWEHADADTVRERINYWGVFVPADEAWRQQVEFASDPLSDSKRSEFRSAMFTTHVQRSVMDCFLQLTHDRPQNDKGFANPRLNTQQEHELCKSLAEIWRLRPRLHSLLGIKQELINRISALYEVTDRPDRFDATIQNCQIQPVQAAVTGLNAFDAAISRYEGHWCLMFDELEIAPAEVQNLLFRSLRSTDQRLLFKLALSPSTQAARVFREITGPSAGNDFDEISLYSDAHEAAVFCETLWRNLARGSELDGRHPIEILGHSTFHAPEAGNPYSKRGRWQEASSRLAKKDPSYVTFLQKYGLDPNALDKATPDQKNSIVRKIGPIVGFKDFLIKETEGADKRPSFRQDKTKPALLYSGWEALCYISEGNPRWFTGIAKALLLRSQTAGRELTKAAQYTAIAASAKKFQGYIATIPSISLGRSHPTSIGLKQLIDNLAKRFREEILEADFPLEPILCFQVDKDSSEDLLQAIFDGLYAGAFVPVGDVERQFAFSAILSEQRLRVTYLLAPLEILPLRAGKSRMLSSLIRQNSTSKHPPRKRVKATTKTTSVEAQSKLFNE